MHKDWRYVSLVQAVGTPRLYCSCQNQLRLLRTGAALPEVLIYVICMCIRCRMSFNGQKKFNKLALVTSAPEAHTTQANTYNHTLTASRCAGGCWTGGGGASPTRRSCASFFACWPCATPSYPRAAPHPTPCATRHATLERYTTDAPYPTRALHSTWSTPWQAAPR